MTPAQLVAPFEAYAGAPFEAYVVLEDTELGDETWRAQIRKRASDSTVVASFTVTAEDGAGIELPEVEDGDPVDQAGNVVITLALSGTQTRALYGSSSAQAVSHVFDLETVEDGVTILRGWIETSGDVSRA